MGMKSIWDGVDIPPLGSEVLIYLASLNAWVPHVVERIGATPEPNGDTTLHRVYVHVVKSPNDIRSNSNSRLLSEVRPMDWREPAP